MKKIALISVSDKTGIVEFASQLEKLNIQILSTGGTYDLLKKSNLSPIKVSDFTGYPEIMDGRVKTLNPKIHGGILGLRDEHQKDAETKKAGRITKHARQRTKKSAEPEVSGRARSE